MRRVTRHACEDGPLLEDQETEGQRRLHGLLVQQLDTDANIDRCLAKRKCFAPAALYKPFGEQAAGVRSLSQFQALQDGEREQTSLRELGLTDTEIELWLSREALHVAEKGVLPAPGAMQQRLQVIRDKMEARAELLACPQRFSASRPLSRREMEIERALFHGNDRLGFLTALYHQEEDAADDQQGATSSNTLDSLYRNVLSEGRKRTSPSQDPPPPHTNQSQSSLTHEDQSQGWTDCQPEPWGQSHRAADESGLSKDTVGQSQLQNRPGRFSAPKRINISQPIGSLCGAVEAGSGGPLTVRGEILEISDGEILENRESEEEIRNIPRFHNYQPGEPSKVLCVRNLTGQASVAQLVALFSRFQGEGGPPVLYRLLTGRLKGQAFITLSDTETAQVALRLVNGYRLLGKPLVIEFGRQRSGEEKEKRGEEEKEEEQREGRPPETQPQS
ncbi:RNA-binding protein 41 [Osmerus eperlanus]|uniref:RNA-binding protein 41 n=1 Tax=Osmerus eperlanus TaxID=29151 RepID=UPI002E116F9F